MWNIRQLLSDQAQACPAKQQQHANRNITIRISHTLTTAEQSKHVRSTPTPFRRHATEMFTGGVITGIYRRSFFFAFRPIQGPAMAPRISGGRKEKYKPDFGSGNMVSHNASGEKRRPGDHAPTLSDKAMTQGP